MTSQLVAPTIMKKNRFRIYTVTLILVVLAGLIAVVAIIIGAGASFLERLWITNSTGKMILVTSSHTHNTIQIPDHQMASVPHGVGDIIVKLPNGESWKYKNLAPIDFRETPYEDRKLYTFFRIQDGYITYGSRTVNLLLDRSGNLYVIPPNAKDIETEKLKQPKGFPLKPS